MTSLDHDTAQSTSRNGRHDKHFGKFRGTVTDNADPRRQGRVRAKVPEVLGDVESGWAMPCVPYAGERSGSHSIPEPGAGVWIEFEAGDVSRPVWVGCWWAADRVPTDNGGTPVRPEVRILRSESGLMLALHDGEERIAVSDSAGTNLVEIQVRAGQTTVKAAATVVIEAPQIQIVDGAGHPAVFGDSLTTYLNQLVQTFNLHMHPGETLGGLPVTPALPAPPAPPPTPNLLSMKVRLG